MSTRTDFPAPEIMCPFLGFGQSAQPKLSLPHKVTQISKSGQKGISFSQISVLFRNVDNDFLAYEQLLLPLNQP